jgi:GT2 family glycosyltransferase
MMPNVLAVVVSYNNADMTRQCVENLLAQTEPCNIVVWDNNSTDHTVGMLEKFRGRAELVLSADNLLWTPALNRAIDTYWEGEDYILMMNNDILIPINGVEEMVKTMKETGAGATAPWGHRLGGMQDVVIWKDKIPGTEPVRAATLAGACYMISREVWEKVGKLDERMPLGADDHDYSMRIKHAGYPLYVTRGFVANHAGHASARTQGGPQQWEDHGAPSWKAFDTKWAGYFATEEEAVKCQWGFEYNDGWDIGTGWDEVTYYERVIKGQY